MLFHAKFPKIFLEQEAEMTVFCKQSRKKEGLEKRKAEPCFLVALQLLHQSGQGSALHTPAISLLLLAQRLLLSRTGVAFWIVVDN